jgi:uncharacterized OB-fold protein
MSAQIPLPLIDSDSRPYWEGLTQHELRIQRCDACTRHVFYPRSICPHCFSDQLSWITATGKGVIYSYTIAHQAYGPFADNVPFTIALVELEEGVRVMTHIVATPREQIVIGATVHVTFEVVGENMTLPYFQVDDK